MLQRPIPAGPWLTGIMASGVPFHRAGAGVNPGGEHLTAPVRDMVEAQVHSAGASWVV